MNTQNDINVNFIMIQIPEKSDNCTYPTISEISKERIRKASKKISENINKEKKETPLLSDREIVFDIGFKVYNYTRSNFKHWKPKEEENIDEVASLFDDLSNPLIDSWKKEDLLTEILLLEGFPLTSQISYLEEMLQNEVYRASAPNFCDHKLFVCLDVAIQPNTIDLLEMDKDDIFICLDSALTDELKARVKDKFNVHII